MLKIQDQAHLFRNLCDVHAEPDLIDQKELESLYQTYSFANKQMRTWIHGLKSKLSNRFDEEVE